VCYWMLCYVTCMFAPLSLLALQVGLSLSPFWIASCCKHEHYLSLLALQVAAAENQ
jgi:hypothetical protein